MKPKILKSRVVCDTCHRELETGDIGGETEYKRCHSCVMKTTAGANRDEILTPDGQKIPKDAGKSFEEQVSNMTKRVNAKSAKPDRFVFEYKWSDINSINPIPRILLLVRYETYEKNLIAEFGLPISQLEEFIKDMKDHEAEMQMDLAEQKKEGEV